MDRPTYLNGGLNFSIRVAVCLAALLIRGNPGSANELPRIRPEAIGMDSSRLAVIEEIVNESLQRERMPGCVVLIGRREGIVYHRAFGNLSVQPEVAEMKTDTLFDMASLTKPIATATSVMLLIQQGKVDPSATVATYIPEFASNGKEHITVHQLLTHQSGLIPDNALVDYQMGPEEAFRRIYALTPTSEPGTRFIYSDVNFITLAAIVQKVTGLNVHEFSRREIFSPLQMNETGYVPDDALRARAAVTQQREGRWMRGEVHDPRAWLLDGIAGHAGLFSTAADLARYATMMLNGGELNGARILSPESVERMTRSYPVPGGFRGLGWDIRTGYSSNRGDMMSPRAFGHGGFTGTGIWIDPINNLYVIFLSNRVHPDGEGSVNPTIGRIGTVAMAAINSPTISSTGNSILNAPVLNGIDVLVRDNFSVLEGCSVGLITNQTGTTRDGLSTAQILRDAANVNLNALFSPEHGINGQLDQSGIADSVDEATGLKVFSLYGQSRQPTDESLEGLDTLVFDIQDIGCRFYTYPSTMGNAMKAAATHGLRFVVLDRVNPIGGLDCTGPVLDAGTESFVGYHTVPVQHGLTIGEYALLMKREQNIDVDLHVVRVEGWRREQRFDECGFTWINPSPNMRNLTQAILYPGVGLLEMTNISVGRGTDTPFEIIGAPWIHGQSLASDLNAAGLSGVRFVPIRFAPNASRFSGTTCGGVNIIITDRDRFESVRTGIQLMCSLRKLYSKEWDTQNLNRLLNSEAVAAAILQGRSVDHVESVWQEDLRQFRNRRQSVLLYP